MIHTQLDDSYHQRSFSFSNWESASKGQSKFYYNYRSRQNQQRGDMPTFGQGSDRRPRQFYIRNLNQQYSYEYDSKSKKQFNSRPNYSVDNWNKAKNIAKKRQPDQYYGNLQNIGNIEIKKGSYHENISNMGYLNSKPSRIQIQRATQQKLSNIDKINEKIKKILNTLNEEQKKISQHHIKVGNKKLASHTFAQRIKTQGSDYYQETNSNLEEKRNIYSKLTGIREKYYQHEDNNLKDISNNSYYLQRSRELSQIDKLYGRDYSKQYSRQQKRQYERIKPNNQSSPFNILKDKYEVKQHKENMFQRNINTKKQGMQYQNKQNKKYDIDSTALKFLKGTNAKSTDSLNLSMSICIKKQNQIPLQEKLQNQQIKVYNPNVVAAKQQSKNFKNENLNIKYNKNQQGNVNNNKSLYMYEKQSIEKENSKYQGERKKQSLNLNKRFEQNQSNIHTPKIAYGVDHGFTRNERTPIKSKNQKSLSRFQRSQKSCKLSNGKDLDAEIQKIQKKIENCDNIKRQFNFQQDDSCKKSRISLQKSLNKYKQLRSSASKQNYQIKRNDSAHFTQKTEKKTINVSQFSTEKISIAQRLRQNQLSQNRKQICQSNKQTNDVEVNLPKPFKMSQKKNSKKTVNNSAVKEIESTLISEERLQFNQQSLKLLVNKLCEQIQLDTKFRNSKKWFNRKPNFSKWNELAKELSYHKIGTNDKQNRQIFTMTQIEDNPFHTDRDQEGSYSTLIQNFLMSQKFWIENLQHKFSREEIQKNIMEIDIQKKGNITIEDMVRYINLQSDKYYRNRDLSLIFRRLSGTRGQVTVEYILAEFCHS